MRATITQIGNSLGLIIPKEIATAMNAKKGESVILEPTSTGFTVRYYDNEIDEQIEAAKEGMAQYKNTLHKLAD